MGSQMLLAQPANRTTLFLYLPRATCDREGFQSDVVRLVMTGHDLVNSAQLITAGRRPAGRCLQVMTQLPVIPAKARDLQQLVWDLARLLEIQTVRFASPLEARPGYPWPKPWNHSH